MADFNTQQNTGHSRLIWVVLIALVLAFVSWRSVAAAVDSSDRSFASKFVSSLVFQGPQGIAGEQGKIGATGTQGSQGIQGKTGEAGIDGKDGVDGAKGATGATGDKGDKGDAGANGTIGATGAAGADGQDGPTVLPHAPTVTALACKQAHPALLKTATLAFSVQLPLAASKVTAQV